MIKLNVTNLSTRSLENLKFERYRGRNVALSLFLGFSNSKFLILTPLLIKFRKTLASLSTSEVVLKMVKMLLEKRGSI